MKDIIAAQHVVRRKRPSLLSTAARLRNAPVTGQRPFKQPFKLSLPRPRFGRLFARLAAGVRANKYSLLAAAVLAILFFLGGLYAVNGGFIPAPEPPGDNAPQGRFAASAGAAEHSDEIPLDLTQTFAWKEYRVKSGDTVEGIARAFGLSLDAVIASNNIRNVRSGLKAGQTIRIPNMDGIPYTVRRGDSYLKIASSQDVPLEAILDANDIQDDSISPGTVLFIPGARMRSEDLKLALGEMFIYPVQGRYTSAFGWRNDPFTHTRLYHAGMDLAAPTGTSVKASAAGRVSAIGFNNIYGNFVILTHGNGYQTMYGHLSKILVSTGSYAGQGALIGRVGNTGRSTGPHLHFAVFKNGRAINPLEILNK
jgi:murein DD-endopeptidase MepM/ murein hydrolase activator NlpD